VLAQVLHFGEVEYEDDGPKEQRTEEADGGEEEGHLVDRGFFEAYLQEHLDRSIINS